MQAWQHLHHNGWAGGLRPRAGPVAGAPGGRLSAANVIARSTDRQPAHGHPRLRGCRYPGEPALLNAPCLWSYTFYPYLTFSIWFLAHCMPICTFDHMSLSSSWFPPPCVPPYTFQQVYAMNNNNNAIIYRLISPSDCHHTGVHRMLHNPRIYLPLVNLF